MKEKNKLIIKYTTITILVLLILALVSLSVYSSNVYRPLDEMNETINNLSFNEYQKHESNSFIKYEVDNPIKHILFIPGGLVDARSYNYLAIQLCEAQYNVTIYKPLFKLAILTPFYIEDYLDKELDNVVVGHSLGGVVGSMVAENNTNIKELILLGSYPIKEITHQEVLIITAENDLLTDNVKINESLSLIKTTYLVETIVGGNHGQFGWYGPQKKDGNATISIINQQDQVVALILDFIQ